MQRIEIHIKGQIDEKWSEWFEGLTVSHPDHGSTLLSGLVMDTASVYGILARLRDLGLQLTSVNSEEIEEITAMGRTPSSQ